MINKIIFFLYFLHLIKTQSETVQNQNHVHIGGGRITIHIKRNLDPSKKSSLGQLFVNVDRMLDDHIDYVMSAILKHQEMMRNEIDLNKDYNKKIENEKDLDFTLEKEDEDTNNTIINNNNDNKNNNKNINKNKDINSTKKDSKNNFETAESIKLREEREKFLKKQKFFSKICKYTLYSIILFTFYILIKKLLEFLEIIEKPSLNEINKEEEEERKQQYEREKVIKEKQVGNKIM